MLIPRLIFEPTPDTDTQGLPYPLKLHRWHGAFHRLSRSHEHLRITYRRAWCVGDVLSPQLLRGLSPTYCTSVRQQERSYFRQLSFCIGFQGCWCVSLHAYKSPSLLSKPVSPEVTERHGVCMTIYSTLPFWDMWQKKSPHCVEDSLSFGGPDETRTRDPMRDRHVF